MRGLVLLLSVAVVGCSVPEAERPAEGVGESGDPAAEPAYDWGVPPEAEGSPVSTPDPTDDSDPEPDVEPAPDPDPGPEIDPDPDPAPDPEPDLDPGADPAREPDPDPEIDPVPEVLGCADACVLGAVDREGRTCSLRDDVAGRWVDVDGAERLEDRARQFERWLAEKGTAHGGVGDAIFADPPAYERRTGLGGTGDSAIWTGTWLAAEALRLMAEGGGADSAAAQRVRAIVRTLHLWFNVSGDPGYLARFAAPSGEHPQVPMDCEDRGTHCGTVYAGDGRAYDWRGHISRDQYSGVMMGYALAYEALAGQGEGGEEARGMIREDVVELLRELLRERTVSVRIHWNGTPIGPIDMTSRYIVESTHEKVDGAAEITVDTNDFGRSDIWAIREFVPNIGPLLRQIPILGALVPERTPRAGSTVMMMAYLRMGMLVTDGVAGLQADHEAFAAHYDEHFDEWMGLAAQWSYGGECGGSYYANNIVMEPMYVLGRLERRHGDPGRADRIAREILDDRMWPEHRRTKNSWFLFMHAANSDRPADRQGGVGEAIRQLDQFPTAPRVSRVVDLRGDPRFQARQDGCAEQVPHDQAIDIADRPPQDFQWQRNPWALQHGGNPAVVYPGVDFLAAYWLGRAEGLIDNPSPDRCLAWR